MNLQKAIEQAKLALRDSHLDVVAITDERLELRGHNRNNKAILATIVYGVLPLAGAFYFWNKEKVIVGLCLLLSALVLAVRLVSLDNTKKSLVAYDHSIGQLSFRNAEVKYQGIRTAEIENVASSVTLITNGQYAGKKWYIANVDLFGSEGAKYTVAQFEAYTPHRPTKQAQALGQLLAAYLTRPYEHMEEIAGV